MFSDKGIETAMSDWQNNSGTEGMFIENFDIKGLTPVGYDLRVGHEGFSWNKKSVIEIGKYGKIKIDPHDTVVIRTLESVTLSKKVAGTVHSIVEKTVIQGLSDISTTIDPGWSGTLLISVHNHCNTYIELKFKEYFCTVCFYEVRLPAEANRNTAPDRRELWSQLLDIDSRQKYNRIRLLIYSLVLALVVAIGLSWYNSSFGSSIAGFLAILSPIIYDRFIKPNI